MNCKHCNDDLTFKRRRRTPFGCKIPQDNLEAVYLNKKGASESGLILDESGNGNDAQLVDSNCGYFDGTAYGRASNTPVHAGSTMNFSCYFRADDYSVNGIVLASKYTTGNREFYFNVVSSRVYLWFSQDGGAVEYAATVPFVALGETYKFELQFNAGVITYSVNDVTQIPLILATITSIYQGTGDFIVGSRIDKYHWRGLLFGMETNGFKYNMAEGGGSVLYNGGPVTFGTDKIVNGDFEDGATGWDVGGWTIENGVARRWGGGGGLEQLVFESDVGKTYKVTFDVIMYNSGTLILGTSGLFGAVDLNVTGVGSYEYEAEVTLEDRFYFSSTSDFDGSIDNVVLVEVLNTDVNIIGATLSTFWGSSQDVDHYNFLNGFDIWEHATDGIIRVPIGANVTQTGYTFVSTNPSGKWHNDAESKIQLPATLKAVVDGDCPNPLSYVEMESNYNDANTMFGNMEEDKHKYIIAYSAEVTETKDLLKIQRCLKMINGEYVLTDDAGVILTDDDGLILVAE